jgi:hypothetical protein
MIARDLIKHRDNVFFTFILYCTRTICVKWKKKRYSLFVLLLFRFKYTVRMMFIFFLFFPTSLECVLPVEWSYIVVYQQDKREPEKWNKTLLLSLKQYAVSVSYYHLFQSTYNAHFLPFRTTLASSILEEWSGEKVTQIFTNNCVWNPCKCNYKFVVVYCVKKYLWVYIIIK